MYSTGSKAIFDCKANRIPQLIEGIVIFQSRKIFFRVFFILFKSSIKKSNTCYLSSTFGHLVSPLEGKANPCCYQK